ncbi:MAG: ATP-grasp domain-containing protein [Pedobacter sp.]|nr:MAG: ATP-grasp domain-containing protein [Pedobacter sp.]
MIHKDIAIVLGGTAPHVALIQNLKSRGYYVVLIDYYENPPAKQFADEHVRESTLDKDKVLQIAKDYKAKLVICACIDQANVTACYVAEQLDLPKPYTYQTALEVTDKGLMKELMVLNHIPTSKYRFVKGLSDVPLAEMKFPLVVKPSDSNGSAGVRKAEDINQLEEYLQKAIEISRTTGGAIVEEYKSGAEVSADCFVLNGEVDVILIRQKYQLPYKEGQVLQSPGSFSPGLISEKKIQDLKEIVKQISRVFNLNNTPLLIQALINEEEINIIEFAPRVGGGLSFRTVYLNTKFDILNSTVNSFLGIEEKPKYEIPSTFLATVIVYAKPGVFKEICGLDQLIEDGIVLEYHAYKTRGMQIGNDMSTRSRIGAFIVEGSTLEEKISKIREAVESIKVFDEEGNDLMLRNIYDDIENQKDII